ncbi:hypothetical protein ACCI51_02880 [Microbulbifer echini]|uniref:Uncharacterized protein n=1 Tax=Microbulbifer echini TaxID=1529067 RepID=A0ABV4NIS6_9GAMM|nr:hypothetical protein [uncultured Microbulbifer sp.]
MPILTGKRGELTRSKSDILKAGGLVPKLGLNVHKGGFSGFLKCNNKVDGVMGCKCPHMDENWLYYRGVALMRGFALDPGLLHVHTASNTAGLLSWAGPGNQSYAGQQTRYTSPDMAIFGWEDGDEALKEVYRRLEMPNAPTKHAFNLFRQHQVKFAMSPDMKVLAMVVKNGVEYSYFTPIKSKDIEFGGIDEGGLQPKEDPALKILRLRRISKDSMEYQIALENIEKKKAIESKPFLDLAQRAQAVNLKWYPVNFRLPQPYSGLGVGRKEKIGL